MANFTAAALPNALVPQRTAALTTVQHQVDPSLLPSYPASGDTIQLFTLPVGARVVDAFLRTTSCGAAGSAVQLQQLLNGTTTNLTTTVGANQPGATGLVDSYGPSARDLVNPITVQLFVTGGALVAPGQIEALIGYENL